MSVYFNTSNITTLVFDFDGTLVKSSLDFDAIREQVHTAIHPLLPQKFQAILHQRKNALPLLEETQTIADSLPQEVSAQIHAITNQVIKNAEIHAAQTSCLFPDTLEVLHAAQKKRLQLGIITRNCTEAVHISFPSANTFFSCILTREDVPAVKPDPRHLYACLDILYSRCSETIMIGDHTMDITTGKRAGCLTAAIATGKQSLPQLERSLPTVATTSLTGFAKTIGIL